MKLDAAERRGDLYPDRHLNVFVPFHGHVLDANVTRAVVSTLRWARPEVTRDFVIELAGRESLMNAISSRAASRARCMSGAP